MMELITTDVWPRITKAVERSPGRCAVAVAYFGKGASKLLPLKKGSTLVVDLSEDAVKSGQTCPSEILKLLNRNVIVHTFAHLHAKVFATGNRAFVGSSNASRRSAKILREAVVSSDSQGLVASCRRYVTSLTGDIVTPYQARQLQRLYRPPKFGDHNHSQPSPLSPLWLVPLRLDRWDEQTEEAFEKGLPTARKRLRSSKHYEVDSFEWEGAGIGNLQRGHLVITFMLEDGGREFVSPPARAIHLRRFGGAAGPRGIVYLEAPRRRRRKSSKMFFAQLGPAGQQVSIGKAAKRLKDDALARAMLQLWR